MLFHITHQHTEDTCPAHDADRMKSTFGALLAAIEETGVDVRGFYANAPAHRVYMIVEAESVEVINKLLYPVLTIGTAEVEPVVETAALTKAFEEAAKK